MTLRHSDHATDDDIDRFLAGTLPAPALLAFDAHLDACPDCRGRAAARRNGGATWAALDTAWNTMADHVPEEELPRYVDGSLSRDRRDEIDRHLRACAACAAEVRDLASFAASTRVSGHRSRRWWFGGALAAALVLLAIGIGAVLRVSVREPVLTVTDGARPLRIGADGTLTGAGPLSAADARLVADAIRSGHLALPATGELREPAGTLMGDTSPAAIQLLSPVATFVVEDRPSFAWTPVADASDYVVTVQDQTTGTTIDSPAVSGTEWTPASPLPRGHLYTWQVSTTIGGRAIVAPRPPAAPVRFGIVTQAVADRLARAPASHLVRGVLAADAGALDAAERELSALAADNPGSPAIARLLDRIRAAKAAPPR